MADDSIQMPPSRAEQRVRQLSRGRKILFSLLPLVIVLAAIEGGARLLERFVPPRPLDLGLAFTEETRHCTIVEPHGRLLLPHPKGVSMEETTFTPEKAPNTFRIVTLGGSSVAFLQEDLIALEAQLSAAYAGQLDAVEVINAGFWAYGSQRVLIVAREMLEYEPDLFVLYSGHNEFEDLRQLEIAEAGPPLLLRLLAHSAFFRILADRVTTHRIHILEETRNIEILKEQPFSSPEEWAARLNAGMLDERMRHYHDNLALIAGMCAQRDVPLIIGTVPSNLWAPSLPPDSMKYFGDELRPLRDSGNYEAFHAGVRELLNTSLRRQSSDVENGIIRKVAAEYGLPIARMEEAVCANEPHGIPGETLFADHCHLNDAGNVLWIKVYTPLIRAEIDRYLAERGGN